MKTDAGTRLKILDAAVTIAAEGGVGDLRVADVARAAGVSSALVHYHFDTKQALLAEASGRAAAEDAAALAAALGTGMGLDTLDALWEALVARVRSGRATFLLEVRLRAGRAPALAAATAEAATAAAEAVGKRLPALLRELGSRVTEPREEVASAVAAFLDGVVLALAGGRAPAEVRAAYDALWLTLIAAGQGARRH